MADKESVFELDMKLEDVLGLMSEISDKGRERNKLDDDALNTLNYQCETIEDMKELLSDLLKLQTEQLGIFKKQSDLTEKSDRRASERRRAEREHVGFLKKSFDWLTGYQGIKGFLNTRVPSLPSMLMGGAATGLGLGVAGYYGYGKMADNASNLRFQGQQYNSNPAELQAAKSVYGGRSFGNVESTLDLITQLRTNAIPAGSVYLEQLVGKTDPSASNAEILSLMPEAIQKQMGRYKKETGDEDLKNIGLPHTLDPYGLGNFNIADIRHSMAMTPEETAGLRGEFQNTTKELSPMLGDKPLEDYQNTKMQMEIAGMRIESAFLDSLGELNPEIQSLTKSVSTLIKDFVQSDIAAKGIDNLKTGLHEFDEWIKDPHRKNILAAVMYDLDVFGGMVYSAASGLGSLAKMLGFVGEKTLLATDYQALMGVRDINPDLADKMKESLENPSDVASRNDAISAFNGLTEPQKKEITEKYGKQFNEIFAGIIKPIEPSWLDKSSPKTTEFMDKMTEGYSRGYEWMINKTSQGMTVIDDLSDKAMGADYAIQKVIKSGAGWVDVQTKDGDIERRTGVRNWRNNNPGNLEYGDFAKSHGAIGTDSRFAVFPEYLTGRKAKESLIFESDLGKKLGTKGNYGAGLGYKDKNLAQAIAAYAPEEDHNDVKKYTNTVLSAVGGEIKRMGDYTQEERRQIMNAMEKVEGFSKGKIETLMSVKNEPVVTPLELRIKSKDALAGGHTKQETLDTAKLLQDTMPEFKEMTAADDAYHHGLSYHSKHTEGTAFDFTVEGGKSRASEIAKQTREILAAQNIQAKVIDEYNRPSKNATGGHIHVELQNLDLKKQHEESAREWKPVVYTRGENSIQMNQGEPRMIAPRKQSSVNCKVTIDNRSGTDLISQSVCAGL